VPGGLDGMLAVIDLSEGGRLDFFESRRQARERNRRDGRAHDFRMQATGVWGITYATGSPIQLRELDLPSYVDKKLKETGAPYWVAIAETSGRSPEFSEVFVRGRPTLGDLDEPSKG
jgi:hypothetical protein